MKIAFLSEMKFEGKVQANHPNMRTEFAWMFALNADHFCIYESKKVINYDHVFLILPKGKLNVNAEGSEISNIINPSSLLLSSDFIDYLKNNNKKVHYIQEGPNWWFNDYAVQDQFNFFNVLTKCDSIYAHNEIDIKFYKGLFPYKPVYKIPTLIIENLVDSIIPSKEPKVIIGGNFARWYGGFQSYIIAHEFDSEKWIQTSHAKRLNEEQIYDLHHLPRLTWVEWMKTLSSFKYAVHLMPTVAAGTFSLNCAYFGIPCIGNELVDSQKICHPDLSVPVDDIDRARKLAFKLRNDEEFYEECSKKSRTLYRQHYNIHTWKKQIETTLL